MNKNTIISQGQFKYYVVDLPHNFSDSENVNFVLLLEYIGKQSIYERYGKTDIGRAYGIIRERTNNKLGLTRKDLILRTSKREVASIRRFFDPNIIRRQRYIKMPYKLEYIFSSIIEILNEIQSNPSIAENVKKYHQALKQFVNRTYVEVFYDAQREAYRAVHHNIGVRAALEFENDFDSPDSSLNQTFN